MQEMVGLAGLLCPLEFQWTSDGLLMDSQWTETETTHNVLSAQSVRLLSDFCWTSDGLLSKKGAECSKLNYISNTAV
jgi:hypothetical protein